MGGANLPEPIGLDLEPTNNQLRPAALELEPRSGTDVAPADLNVAPLNLDVAPLDANMLEPKRARAPGEPGAPEVDLDARPGFAKPIGGPTPRDIERPAVSRGLLFGGAAVLLVGALGAGLFYSGVFDEDPAPPGARGIAGPKASGGGAEGGTAPTTPAGPAAERSDAIFAKFDADTPASYQSASEAAAEAGDLVGQAEAKLLLSLRYGPDASLVAEAKATLGRYADSTEGFVTRVRGLLAIASSDFAGAAKSLAGDAPRLALYRAMLRSAEGKPDDAIVEAKSALSNNPKWLAALSLQHAAELDKDPVAAAASIAADAAKHPDHPGLAELHARASLANGEIGTAAAAIGKLAPAETAPAAYRARVSTLRGELALARGDYGTAINEFDAALALAKSPTTQIARVRALMATLDYKEAQLGLDQFLEANPKSLDGAILRVELAVETGEGETALALITELEKAIPERLEIPYLRGQVQAMRLQIDEAKAEFAKVVEKDPTFFPAAIAEAEMLHAGRKGVEAIATLDAAVGRLTDPADKAEVLTKKAEILLDQQQERAALAALDAALNASSKHNAAAVLRGTLRIESGAFEAGKKDLLGVYERAGGYPGLSAPLGRIFVREGKIAELEKLVGDKASNPRAPAEVKLVAARLRLAQGRSDDAKLLIDEALAKEPNSWEGKMLMARAFLDGGDPAEALERIEGVRPPSPRAEVYLLRGKILEFNGRHDEARPNYVKALSVDAELLEARFLHGRLLAYAGASKQAAEELSTVCDATDQFPRACLNLGLAQRDLGKFDNALTSLGRATTLDDKLYKAYYLEGRIHADRNRHAKAIAAFEKAVDTGAKDEQWYVDAWMSLGRAQSKGGKKGAAKASFKKFLELAPAEHPSRTEAERQLRG